MKQSGFNPDCGELLTPRGEDGSIPSPATKDDDMKCNICGKQYENNKGFHIYPNKCGGIVRCFEHSDTGFVGMPDFGHDYCKKCGDKLIYLRESERRNSQYCRKCGKRRSGRNVVHVHGKDCLIKEDTE